MRLAHKLLYPQILYRCSAGELPEATARYDNDGIRTATMLDPRSFRLVEDHYRRARHNRPGGIATNPDTPPSLVRLPIAVTLRGIFERDQTDGRNLALSRDVH